MEPGWLQKLCENHWFINTPNKFDKTDNVVYNKQKPNVRFLLKGASYAEKI